MCTLVSAVTAAAAAVLVAVAEFIRNIVILEYSADKYHAMYLYHLLVIFCIFVLLVLFHYINTKLYIMGFVQTIRGTKLTGSLQVTVDVVDSRAKGLPSSLQALQA